MLITPEIVGAIGVLFGIASVVIGWFVKSLMERFKDRIRELSEDVKNARETQKTLFGKIDSLNKDIQDQRLAMSKEMQDQRVHVAETYVSETALEKTMAPMREMLDDIRQQLKEIRLAQ